MKGNKREDENKGKAESEALISSPTTPESCLFSVSFLNLHWYSSLSPSLLSLNLTHPNLELPLFPYNFFIVISGTSLILQVYQVGNDGVTFSCFPSVASDKRETPVFPTHFHWYYPSFMARLWPWSLTVVCASESLLVVPSLSSTPQGWGVRKVREVFMFILFLREPDILASGEHSHT